MFDPFVPSTWEHETQHAFKILRGFRAHDAIRVLKTWSNAWCTSGRFHEEVRLPCLLGCAGATDEQAHYCMCPYLYAIQKYLWQPIGTISEDPICRLGLRDPTSDSLLAVTCTFSAYHNLKFTNAARFHPAGDLDPTQPLTTATQSSFLRSFAEVFRTEALELGRPARCFDFIEFDKFVNGQSALAALEMPVSTLGDQEIPPEADNALGGAHQAGG